MQRALLAGILIGSLCAVIGVYVVLKGMSFMGAGISHAAFGGVAIGFLLQIDPVLSSIIFCVASGLGIAYISKKSRIKEDTTIGIFFASTMALGILIFGLLKGVNVDLFGYLFGNILSVTLNDLYLALLVEGVVFFFVLYYYKELLLLVLDQEMAEVSGIPVSIIYYLLVSFISLTIVISIKVVGIVLVSALLIIPSAAALQITDNFKKALITAIVFGVASSGGGLILSYFLDTPSGATIVLVATIIFLVTSIFSSKKKG
ncbi:metal ABC transporter permease [Atribacter laminatus]|jgi:ABC-type Mn2+/Zn2+ transport system permease subunit|uniref:Manganese transport system membrane protein MntB n=1 Tax=Atribacter laminatus TaxID=2847778 RepID=A0A7T1AMR0_ATRLM|nr:metal ABC transporter permease [Atribacter laminatus]QPM68743.1 Manganese transport system membrane protein MntB [Atribacter laminatus]